MDDLKNKKVLVLDWGQCVEMALRLARDFGQVYYWTNWQDAAPMSTKALIGRGLESENVVKVDYFWDFVDEVDLICSFDTYNQDIVEYLRENGYRVFGPGRAEYLESNRKYGREVQATAGLPVQPTVEVRGLKALAEKLKQEGDFFVKRNALRGDIETFYARDYQSAKIYLDKLSVMLGPRQENVEFMLEKKIKGIEPGFDGIVVDGKYANNCMWGYERKESGYIGQVVKYDELPPVIKESPDKLASFFASMKTRSFFSTEIILDAEKTGYLIDPTVRCPMPVGGALHQELWSNLGQFIWHAAAGEVVDLIPAFKYGCGTSLASPWAAQNWLEVEIDPKIRNRVKFSQLMMQDGKYFLVPGTGSEPACSVIGMGNTVDEALAQLKENIKGVSGFELDSDIGGIENILEDIREGAKYGLPDFTGGGDEEEYQAVDFDGTLAEYHGYGDGSLGKPVPKMIERVRNWIAAGKKVKVVTARANDGDAEIKKIQEWTVNVFGQALEVTSNKDRFMLELWDDRAVRVKENTGEVDNNYQEG